MDFTFSELVNVPLIQAMSERLYQIAGIPIGILNVDRSIWVQAGWQRICTEFHRKTPASCERCLISDRIVDAHLQEGRSVAYKCGNSMWDIAQPILVNGRHVATLFLGQFFYDDETIDEDLFARQADLFGYDRNAYLEALHEVPVFSRERVDGILDYYQLYISMLVESGQRNLENQMHIRSIRQYADIVSSMRDGLLTFRLGSSESDSPVLTSINDAALQLLELPDASSGTMLGRPVTELIRSHLHDDLFHQVLAIIRRHGTADAGVLRLDNNDPESAPSSLSMEAKQRWLSFKLFPIPDNSLCLMLEDITERTKAEQEIRYLSYHDQLTGLYNRRYFAESLERLDRDAFYPLSLLIADLNGLKLINDSFGHQQGDLLLQEFAGILTSSFRKDEVVVRLGGDEFVVLLPNTDAAQAECIIERISARSGERKIGPVTVSVSYGIATKTESTDSMDDVLKRAEDRMYRRKLVESPNMRSRTISTILSTLHEGLPQEKEHAERVSDLCVRFGRSLEMSPADIDVLRTAAHYHDIGKIGLEMSLLTRGTAYMEQDYEEMRKHAEIGARILGAVSGMTDMADLVLYHHERWDGKGYPRGLAATEIPFQSRIIAIADAYEAITGERTWRGRRSHSEALEEIRRCAGTQFDPMLVDVFMTIFEGHT